MERIRLHVAWEPQRGEERAAKKQRRANTFGDEWKLPKKETVEDEKLEPELSCFQWATITTLTSDSQARDGGRGREEEWVGGWCGVVVCNPIKRNTLRIHFDLFTDFIVCPSVFPSHLVSPPPSPVTIDFQCHWLPGWMDTVVMV